MSADTIRVRVYLRPRIKCELIGAGWR